MQIESILKAFGLNEKEIAVYLALIELGPSPVRLVSAKSGVNRGTTYDILKALIDLGLVSYFNKQSHQYFSAESPQKLLLAIQAKSENIAKLKIQIEEELPYLQALFEKQGGKPAVKLFEGTKGLKAILEDVLETVSRQSIKEYFVYSSVNLRKDVYNAYPNFSDIRKSKKIKVKTIALGEGGQLVGLDERKWLNSSLNLSSPIMGEGKSPNSTYEIIFAGKVAHISLDDTSNPVVVLIQNQSIYETQRAVFESLWEKL
jgi:sugar-specific transcriptional regulator TrmB